MRVVQGKPESKADAAKHLDIALQHLENGAIRLALIGGNPGTGKSTLARALAESSGAQVISTDDVRRELQASGAISGGTGVLDAGLYAPGNVAIVYEVVLRRAQVLLSEGQSVILDGTWRDPQLRAQAYRVAVETHSALVDLMCVASTDMAAERIKERRGGNSDVTPEIADALDAHDGWDDACRVDTSRGLEQSVLLAQNIWRQAI
jgi:predicted kinase